VTTVDVEIGPAALARLIRRALIARHPSRPLRDWIEDTAQPAHACPRVCAATHYRAPITRPPNGR